jgi:hypothetical protein
MNKIGLQDIFNAAWQAFIVEDRPPGLTDKGDCAYRTDDGRACAVGLCLPDDHEATKSGMIFANVVEEWPELFDETLIAMADDDEESYRLNDFQDRMHDELINRHTRTWGLTKTERAARYREVARHYGLTVPAEAA